MLNIMFYFDELTSANITPNVQYTEINAGWSLYPVAYLPGTSSFEMQITSGKFEAELFSMANGTQFIENSSYRMPAVEHLNPDNQGSVELAHVPIPETLYIDGLTRIAYNSTLGTGKYKLASNADDEQTLEFYMGDPSATPNPVPADIPDGTTIEIHYEYIKTVKEAQIDNRSSAIGEAILVWPVYASSDECAVSSSIIGYVVMRVYRCRVTAAPGFDSSLTLGSSYSNVC